MELELFIIIALIIVFLVSCCGLIQKIKDNYEEDRGRIISVTQIHVPNQMYNNNAYLGDEVSSGIFPDTLAPPPYADHLEPPPRYEDLVKDNQFTVIEMVPQTSGASLDISTNQSGAENQEHPSPTRINVH